MNKNKEVMIKICVLCSIYTASLGINSLLHKENYNENKFTYEKKVEATKLNKNDDFSIFMKKVNESEVKRNRKN